MKPAELVDQIDEKAVSKEELANCVAQQPDLLSVVVDGLSSKRANVKYGCSKILLLLSEQHPDLLYPRIQTFIKLLKSELNPIKWCAIQVVGNLAKVDDQQQIDKILTWYLRPIQGDVMITAGNVMRGATQIALARPGLADRIARQLVKVETAEYQTPECRLIALGKAIDSAAKIIDLVSQPRDLLAFVERQLDCPRDGTRKKAEKFVKKFSSKFSSP